MFQLEALVRFLKGTQKKPKATPKKKGPAQK